MFTNFAVVASGILLATIVGRHQSQWGTEDTCTPIESCQIGITSSGLWGVTLGIATNGSCECHHEECLTKNCKYVADLTPGIPIGQSAMVGTTCYTQATITAQRVRVGNCGGSDTVLAFIYATSDCTGAIVGVSGYTVTCDDTKCGDGICP